VLAPTKHARTVSVSAVAEILGQLDHAGQRPGSGWADDKGTARSTAPGQDGGSQQGRCVPAVGSALPEQ
jgi:hypothetical protein